MQSRITFSFADLEIKYIGPVARKFGSYGGGVGIYMSGVITLIVYLATRILEIMLADD